MTPLPKRRISSRRRGLRRAAIKLELPQLVRCENPSCGRLKIPHQMCGACGYYNKQLVMKVKST